MLRGEYTNSILLRLKGSFDIKGLMYKLSIERANKLILLYKNAK